MMAFSIGGSASLNTASGRFPAPDRRCSILRLWIVLKLVPDWVGARAHGPLLVRDVALQTPAVYLGRGGDDVGLIVVDVDEEVGDTGGEVCLIALYEGHLNRQKDRLVSESDCGK